MATELATADLDSFDVTWNGRTNPAGNLGDIGGTVFESDSPSFTDVLPPYSATLFEVDELG